MGRREMKGEEREWGRGRRGSEGEEGEGEGEGVGRRERGM